ncbi:glycosyltransferase family 9 protein [Halomonas sp. SpR8]|uniref:glycosyltransferase family 9 protein n=1 Tax=Halomonas sp. SpR8 TaxID=3050463 RepID=UPI0027E3BF67|nr:glycosyltransferase family 9 protein [Halomonas sp. SpR8]MDQ7730442.1 glycosyltransferase family 9 protein [Halomonas sp. SpR8]
MKDKTQSLNSICIMRLSALGDVTHVIPVIKSLQAQVPDIEITWVIGKLEAKLIGDLPGVEFIIFDKKAGLEGYRALRRVMQGRHFDALLHMQVSLRANIAAALIPATTKIGYDKARSKDLHSFFINRRIPAKPEQHVRDCLASFLEPLGLMPAPPRWQIPLKDADYSLANQYLVEDRINLVISPCASHVLRNWSSSRYAELADYAVATYGANVILVGSPAAFEKKVCGEIEALMHEKVANICGQDTLKQLTALLEKADLLVSPDTGPAHIANAMGTDVLGLYAASNPNRSGPYGSLSWCVNRYPEALHKFTSKTVAQARWGAKAEFEGAMEMISVDDVTATLDRWVTDYRESSQ